MIPQSLKTMPISPTGWHIVIRRLQTWIVPEEENAPPLRPVLVAAINQSEGSIHGTHIGPQPTPEEALQMLYSFMTDPEKETGANPQRPERLLFENQAWLKALSPALREAGFECRYRAHPAHLDDLLTDLEEHMRDGAPLLPGLLSQRGVTPALAGSVYAAAAAFCRAEPWVSLANADILALQMPGDKQPRYVTVMGQGGMEYGLVRYDRWEDVIRQYTPHKSHGEGLSPLGHHVFFFNTITETSFQDLDDAERYGWEALPNNRHPVPLVVFPTGQVRRPAGADMQWYDAALRAIPVFVSEHLELDKAGFPVRGEAEVAVKTNNGNVKVSIRYAAGDLPDELRHGYNLDYEEEEDFGFDDEDDEEDDEAMSHLLFDPRVMEGMMRQKHLEMGADSLTAPDVEQAQDVMYQAWAEKDPAKRLDLARKALSISQDCADAYVLLAQEKAGDLKTALRYYQDGVEAGRRALPQSLIDEHTGSLWMILPARPYLRALSGAADCLKELGRHEEALPIYRELLRLNSGDNQGVRYSLTSLLLAMRSHADLRALLDQYKDDPTANWTYSAALLAYREGGDTPAARKAAKKALKANPHVLKYLKGDTRIPTVQPRMMGFGDESEAVVYAADNLNHWRRTPGAVDWLAAQPQPKTPAGKKAAKKAAKSRFAPGDFVQVRKGNRDDDSGVPLDGWVGEVVEVDEDDPDYGVLVSWDAKTLRAMPEKFIFSCDEAGEDWDGMYLSDVDLKPAIRRDTDEERDAVLKEMHTRYAWGYLGEQGLRLNRILQGIDMEDTRGALARWQEYLGGQLVLPLNAVMEENLSRHFKENDEVEIITIEAEYDTDNGLMARVRRGRHEDVAPLNILYLEGDTPAAEALDDYQAWMDDQDMGQ